MNPEEERRLKEKFKIEDGMPQPSEVMGDAQNAQAVPSK
jgi:hypothetical protein